LADARDVDDAPLLAGPQGADADPAGAVLVELAVAVPVELDLHAAVLVGEDLLAVGADDDGGLGAVDAGPGRPPRRPEGQGRRDALELVAVDDRAGLLRGVRAGHAGGVGQAGQHVGAVGVEVLLQGELVADDEVAAVTLAGEHQARQRLLLHADADGPPAVPGDLADLGGLGGAAGVDAVVALGEAAGVVVDFQLVVVGHLELVGHRAHGDGRLDRLGRLKMIRGLLEAVVPERQLARADLLRFGPDHDALGQLDAAGAVVEG